MPGSNASAWKHSEAGAPPWLPGRTQPRCLMTQLAGRNRPPSIHMAAWLPQGFVPGLLHAHMECLLGFRHRDATCLSSGLRQKHIEQR